MCSIETYIHTERGEGRGGEWAEEEGKEEREDERERMRERRPDSGVKQLTPNLDEDPKVLITTAH